MTNLLAPLYFCVTSFRVFTFIEMLVDADFLNRDEDKCDFCRFGCGRWERHSCGIPDPKWDYKFLGCSTLNLVLEERKWKQLFG